MFRSRPAPALRFLSGFLAGCLSVGFAQSGTSPALTRTTTPTNATATTLPPPPPDVVSRVWQVDDGLPHNVVNTLVQDGRGFLWLATAGGLARFDGREFKDYPLPGSPAPAGYNIRDLALEDPRTLVLLPASGGVLRLRDGVYEAHPASAALSGRALLHLFSEANGTLWVDVGSSELARWSPSGFKLFGPADGYNRRVTRTTFAYDDRHRLWLACGDLLARYEAGHLVRFPTPVGSNVWIASSRRGGMWISSSERLMRLENDQLITVREGLEWRTTERQGMQQMYEDERGALWIASRRRGLFRFADGQITSIEVSADSVNGIAADDAKNLWIATNGGGLVRLRPRSFVMLDATTGLPDDVSTSIAEGRDGVLWCANRSGGLVRVADGRIEAIGRSDRGATPGYANAVALDRAGRVWVGTIEGVYRLTPAPGAKLQPMSPRLREVHVMYAAHNGDIWVGSAGHGFGYFRDDTYHPVIAADDPRTSRIRAVAEDSVGRFWVAADDQQLYELIDEKLVPRITREQLPGGPIFAIEPDPRGPLWLATASGLLRLVGSRLDRFTKTQGLPDDLISQLLLDDRGHLWCGSRRGIFSVSLSELDAVADGRAPSLNAALFGREEGLVGTSALNNTQPMTLKAHDGRLWLATHEGLVGIDPAGFLPAQPPPRVYIDEVTLDTVPQPVGRSLRIPAGAHQLEFKFAALNYSAPEKVRVRHAISGYDLDWNDSSADRGAVYPRLPAGNYTLRVAARNQDGPWSAPTTLALVVVPAWWQTWWAAGGAVVLFAGAVGGSVRLWSHRRLRRRLENLEQAHALEKERARIARDLHDELGGSLTQIGLVAERIKRQAAQSSFEPGLGQLAAQTRRLSGELESIVWTVSPKNDTWDRLAAYIGQFAQRFFRETSIACTVHQTIPIPPLPLRPDAQHHVLAVAKEALNNVLKHSSATKVELTLSLADRMFELRIADDGLGFDPASAVHAERNGLANMRARMSEIDGELTIASTPGRGSVITLRAPVAPPL